jgi:uncharacterized protein YrrD
MLITVRDLQGYAIAATDGDIGSVHDVYFDDRRWTVRYLVVDTGKWLPGRRVLISPMSVSGVSLADERVAVRLTREQVEHSPDLETDGPITRQYETALVRHYGLDPYWLGPLRWGAVPYPLEAVPPGRLDPPVDPAAREVLAREGLDNVGDPHVEGLAGERGEGHLRSARELIGSGIQATDDELGHVEDFLIDDRSWAVRYVIVDTGNWWPGKKVLIAPEWIGLVSWADSRVHLAMSREQIRRAPEYDPSRPVEREHERRLWEYYERPPYWDDEPEDRDRAA